MFSVGKKKDSSKRNLIRLHPISGGTTIHFGNQLFQGVSPDLFVSLDLNDFSQPYEITRKFNISIAINPRLWNVDEFLAHLTSGDLEETDKCKLHGDIDSGLSVSNQLMSLLTHDEFYVGGMKYVYHSIGVACNPNYASVSSRQGNDFENRSSHFEIKFQRQSNEASPIDYLCLNIHLMPEKNKPYEKKHALERLKQAINLFYAELGLSARYTPRTNLQLALTVTLDDYESQGFSCKHARSLEALEQFKLYSKNTVGALKKKRLTFFEAIMERAIKQTPPASLNTAPEPNAVIVTTDVLPTVAEVVPAARPNAWSKRPTI